MVQDRVIFSEENHIYTYNGEPYTSVSSVIGTYKQPFRSDYWSSYKAIERLLPDDEFEYLKDLWRGLGREMDNDAFIEFCMPSLDEAEFLTKRQEVLAEWKAKNKKSIDKGNRYHLQQEERSYEAGKEQNPFDLKLYDTAPKLELPEGIDNMARADDLSELETGFYPELVLFNHKYKIAGQADKIFIDRKRKYNYSDVDDYKTNLKIKKSIWSRKLRGPIKMKPPVQHINDANLYHYQLQISLYAWMLEQFGFKVRNTAFHHFNQTYDFRYRKKDVEAILEDYRKNHMS